MTGMNFARMYQVNAHHVSERAFHQIPLRRGPRGVAQGRLLPTLTHSTLTHSTLPGRGCPAGAYELGSSVGMRPPGARRPKRTAPWAQHPRRKRAPAGPHSGGGGSRGRGTRPGAFPGGASPRVRIGAARLWLRLSTGVGCLASFQGKLRFHVKITLRF